MTAVIAVGWGLLGVAAGLGVNRFSRWLAGIESRGLSPEERIVTRLILDLVILPGCAVALILSFITPWTPALSWPAPDWRTAAVAGVATAAVFALLVLVATLIYGPEGMGIGDIKLALFIGLATGLTDFRVVRAILLGVFLGGFVAILLVVTRIRKMRQAIPYGPFLVLGTLITLLVQRP